MADVVRDAIDAELAAIVRVAPTPVAPFGYGTDVSCTTDVDESWSEVSGFTVLGQALFRRYITPRGSLPDDGTYGLDLAEYLNRATDRSEVLELESKIQGEARKDDRVDSAKAEVTSPKVDGSELRVRIVVRPVNPSVGAFEMTLAVTSAGAVLEAMGRVG